jgi:signal peptide peptidase SppA
MKSLAQAIKSGTPLMVDPFVAQSHIDRVAQYTSIQSVLVSKTAADVKTMLEMVFGPQPKYEVNEGVAYIPLMGVIGKGLTALDKATGACDLDDVQDWITAAAEDPNVKAVVMDVNSPGGTVVGTPETAAAYRALGKIKPTLSFCDSDCLSAAYYIASQGNRFIATPSSSIGNVGVFCAIADMTEAMQKAGIKMRVYKAGKYKGMGHPGVEITDEMDSHLQADVDSDWHMFKQAVKSVRSYASDADLEGQTFSGKIASDKHLITGVAGSWEQAVRNLIS